MLKASSRHLFTLQQLIGPATTSARLLFTRRAMASSATTQKHEWLIILPDQEGALERRLRVRSQHLEEITPAVDSGFCVFGGAFMGDVPKEGEVPQMRGSVMLAVAESKEEVLRRLKEDVYTTAQVWDWGKVQIWPFKSAIRKAL